MKNSVLTLFLLVTLSTTCHAQSYTVFAIKGKAYVDYNDQRNELSLGDVISRESYIFVPEGSKVLLMDKKKKKKMPVINGPVNGTIIETIKKKERIDYIKCAKEVFNYIVGRNANDFGSVDEDGNFVVNARSQRSIFQYEYPNQSELDKGLLQIMNSFYQGNTE